MAAPGWSEPPAGSSLHVWPCPWLPAHPWLCQTEGLAAERVLGQHLQRRVPQLWSSVTAWNPGDCAADFETFSEKALGHISVLKIYQEKKEAYFLNKNRANFLQNVPLRCLSPREGADQT